jgi:hypothetical protein
MAAMTDRPVAPNEVEEPIINSPFVAPTQHWRIEKGLPPMKAEGRRPGSYYYRVPAGAARGRQRKTQLALLAETDIGQLEELHATAVLRANRGSRNHHLSDRGERALSKRAAGDSEG